MLKSPLPRVLRSYLLQNFACNIHEMEWAPKVIHIEARYSQTEEKSVYLVALPRGWDWDYPYKSHDYSSDGRLMAHRLWLQANEVDKYKRTARRLFF